MLARYAVRSSRMMARASKCTWAQTPRWMSAAAASATLEPTEITVARGDGIGPEIMDATLRILEASKAQLVTHEIEIGEKVYQAGFTSGIKPEAWDLLRSTKVFLKAPITTPTGGGYKSLNVSVRKTLGLFANVRPVKSMHPFVHCDRHPIDMGLMARGVGVIIRENEEDLYAGIEHQQTPDVTQCLKIITRQGCERIARYAFDFARRNNRKRVTCMVKDNIMKMTDGLFYRVFEEIGALEYPDISRDRMIIDIGAAMVADDPGRFDVILTTNLYGDIISDVAVQVAGSVGLGGSSNVGTSCAMFEAVHGSAPDISGKNIANPSGLLLGAVQMLQHIRQPGAAEQIYNAWLRTIEDGCHTVDIYNPENEKVGSKYKMGTTEFADAVIERLGQEPVSMTPVRYTGKAQAAAMGQGHGSSAGEGEGTSESPRWTPVRKEKKLHGVDAFVQWEGQDPDALAATLKAACEKAGVEDLELRLITNRGVRCWPEHFPETFLVDHWRCRFRPAGGDDAGDVPIGSVLKVLSAVAESGDGVDLIKMEGLFLFGGELGFSLGQGE